MRSALNSIKDIDSCPEMLPDNENPAVAVSKEDSMSNNLPDSAENVSDGYLADVSENKASSLLFISSFNNSMIYSTILILFMKDDCYRLSELSGFDDPAALLPLPQAPLPSLETAITPSSDVTALLPQKEDLRFTTVESAPPTQNDSLMSAKLSQYVKEPLSSSSSSIHMADLP